jgi:hypothetical protein
MTDSSPSARYPVPRRGWTDDVTGELHVVDQRRGSTRATGTTPHSARNGRTSTSGAPAVGDTSQRTVRQDGADCTIVRSGSHLSFQAPDKIKQALAHGSDVSLWPSVGERLAGHGTGELTSQDAVVACLKDIVHRRNKIAHEADRDPADGTKRLSISADEVSLTVDQVEQIAAAIAGVLGSPPAAVSDRPVPDGRSAQVTATVVRTPKQMLYQQFWAEFTPVVKRYGWTKAAPPAVNGWNMPGGVADTTWAVSFSNFGCRAELYFEHTNPAINLARWRILFERRDEIAARFGSELIFDDLPNNKVVESRHGCSASRSMTGRNGRAYAIGWRTLRCDSVRRSIRWAVFRTSWLRPGSTKMRGGPTWSSTGQVGHQVG